VRCRFPSAVAVDARLVYFIEQVGGGGGALVRTPK